MLLPIDGRLFRPAFNNCHWCRYKPERCPHEEMIQSVPKPCVRPTRTQWAEDYVPGIILTDRALKPRCLHIYQDCAISTCYCNLSISLAHSLCRGINCVTTGRGAEFGTPMFESSYRLAKATYQRLASVRVHSAVCALPGFPRNFRTTRKPHRAYHSVPGNPPRRAMCH